MDRIYADGSILNKQEAWADSSVNPKHYGVPATNVVKWRNPDLPGRKNIMVAVGKAHAKTLLCIGGSTMAELEAERTADAEQAAAQAEQGAARARALATEADLRRRRREAEDEVDQGEHRVGSGNRNSYPVTKKPVGPAPCFCSFEAGAVFTLPKPAAAPHILLA